MTWGDTDKAAYCFSQCFMIRVATDPYSDPSPIIRRALLLPPVVMSVSDVAIIRSNFTRRVQAIIDWTTAVPTQAILSDLILLDAEIPHLLPLAHLVPNPPAGLQTPHFYLHYHGGFDRPLQELVCELWMKCAYKDMMKPAEHLLRRGSGECCEHSGLRVRKAGGLEPPPLSTSSSFFVHTCAWLLLTERLPSEKKRIGFISSFLAAGEPHGLLLQSMITSLPSEHYHKIALAIGSPNIATPIYDAVSERYSIGYDYFKAVALIEGLELDCLVFFEMQVRSSTRQGETAN